MAAATKIRRALISVYDKTGIVDFARALHDEFKIEIISTGGTARTLTEAGIPVTLVETITGFPEMLDGRVKTLHPKIHAAILADRDNPEHMRQLKEQRIDPIDMVVVNLYPFEKTIADPDCTVEQAIEMIDIGGPCLLRAAAKNHKHVLVVDDFDQYDNTLSAMRGEFIFPDNDPDNRRLLAAYGFWGTGTYDARIAEWIGKRSEISASPWLTPIFTRNWGSIKYGENPHQKAELLENLQDTQFCLPTADSIHDEEEGRVTFNNYIDATAAIELCSELTRAESAASRSVCCFIKHTNACGTGIADDPIEAYRRAYLGDPNAAMGGVLAVNFTVTAGFAEAVMDSLARWGKAAGAGAFFVEVWLAPSFDDDAVEIIRTRKKWGERVRLLDVNDMSIEPDSTEMDIKKIAGGLLMQTRDLIGLNEDQWKVATKRQPTKQEMQDLRLAWLIAKHTKSNAISICKDGRLIGNGVGQTSRVMSCRIATWLAKENGHADALSESAAASDGFFPFRDGLDLLTDASVTAVIQPGGSKRDEEVVAAADERGVAMVLTGTRHFKH